MAIIAGLLGYLITGSVGWGIFWFLVVAIYTA